MLELPPYIQDRIQVLGDHTLVLPKVKNWKNLAFSASIIKADIMKGTTFFKTK